MTGARHSHVAVRPDDGRTLRTDLARRQVVDGVMEKLVDQGRFQLLWKEIEAASGKGRGQLTRYFATATLLMRCVARRHPGRVVDAIGLEPATRARLTERDVKAIAWAVLAGRRLERI